MGGVGRPVGVHEPPEEWLGAEVQQHAGGFTFHDGLAIDEEIDAILADHTPL